MLGTKKADRQGSEEEGPYIELQIMSIYFKHGIHRPYIEFWITLYTHLF